MICPTYDAVLAASPALDEPEEHLPPCPVESCCPTCHPALAKKIDRELVGSTWGTESMVRQAQECVASPVRIRFASTGPMLSLALLGGVS